MITWTTLHLHLLICFSLYWCLFIYKCCCFLLISFVWISAKPIWAQIPQVVCNFVFLTIHSFYPATRQYRHMIMEAVTAVLLQTWEFWDVMPCHAMFPLTWRHIPEDYQSWSSSLHNSVHAMSLPLSIIRLCEQQCRADIIRVVLCIWVCFKWMSSQTNSMEQSPCEADSSSARQEIIKTWNP